MSLGFGTPIINSALIFCFEFNKEHPANVEVLSYLRGLAMMKAKNGLIASQKLDFFQFLRC